MSQWIKSWLGLKKVTFTYVIEEINKKWEFRGLKGMDQVMQEYQETSDQFQKKKYLPAEVDLS